MNELGDSLPRVSVIVRTRASTARKHMLRRALDSILAQRAVEVEPIVVLNSNDAYDPEVVKWLRDDPRIVWDTLAGASTAEATLRGRTLATGEFFAFLDDDDELYEDSLVRRTKELLADPSLDCIATNGEYVTSDGIRAVFTDVNYFERDYCMSILKRKNWMASCGAVFRSSTIPAFYFEGLTPHCEWTLVAFRIAMERKVRFIDSWTYRINDTADSGSKMREYVETIPDTFADMLRWTNEPKYVRQIKIARAKAYFRAAAYNRIHGDMMRAWHFLKKNARESLYGWIYLPYAVLLLFRVRKRKNELVRWPIRS